MFFSVLDLHPEDLCIIKLKFVIVINFSKDIYVVLGPYTLVLVNKDPVSRLHSDLN